MSADEPSDPGAGRRGRRGVSAPIVARILLVVILIGVPVGGVLVAIDLFVVRSSLQEARTALGDVGGSLGDIDIEAAATSLQVADEQLDRARTRSSGFTWSVASVAPFLGASIEVTREVVEVASSAVDLATIVVDDGRQLLDEGVNIQVIDGRVDLAPMLAAQQVVGRLPIDRLSTARDALGQPRGDWLPAEIRQGRADTLELADQTLDAVIRARALSDALPGFLGAEGQRRYFVGFQTSAEQRGTGGLIGYWGVMVVDDGQVGFGQSEVFDPTDGVEDPEAATSVSGVPRMGLSYDNPPNVDPEFLGRYATLSAARSFPNINLDPDLPTTSKAILDLYELQNGDRLDGVILLDPPGLQGMLEVAGSTLPLGEELSATLGLDDGLPTERFSQFVTADIYDTLGSDFSDERDAAQQLIGDAAFATLFDGSWDSTAMIRAVAEAARHKHVQVFSTDEQVQAAFVEVNAAGSLQLPAEADLFAVTANNAVGGKQDVHLGHEFRLGIQLADVRQDDDGNLSAWRASTLAVTVDNPLPTSGMDEYIIGSCYTPGGANECFEGEPGSNRTWFSLWTDPATEVVGFRSDAGTAPGRYDKTFRGLRVVDYFNDTASQQRSTFAFDADGWTPLRRTPESVIYELSWWRQAKAIPDLLDVAIAPPEGWMIDRVEVVGGGDGRGSGVHGEGQELLAEVADGAATLRGTVTADTRLLVHLVGDED
jgi:hypothetical protein